MLSASDGEGSGHNGVVGPLSSLFAGQKPGFDQDLHVVRDRPLAEPDGVDELADAGFAVLVGGDDRQQAQPGRVGQGLQCASELVGLSVGQDAAGHGRTAGRFRLGERLGWEAVMAQVCHVLTLVNGRVAYALIAIDLMKGLSRDHD